MIGRIFLLTLCLSSVPLAHAIDFTTVLKDLNGHDLVQEVRNGDRVEKEVITLGTVATIALLFTTQGEKVPIDQHVKRLETALKIRKCADCALPAEDIATIKKNLPEIGFSMLVTGQVAPLIDPDAYKEK